MLVQPAAETTDTALKPLNDSVRDHIVRQWSPRSVSRIGGLLLAVVATLILGVPARAQQRPPYLDESLSFEQRAHDLVSRMSLEEKVMQMKDVAPAIPRLDVPEYNWWNEALHGVARAGLATVFPQAIAVAATWDDSAMFQMATVISDEARAKHHEYLRH